MSQPSHQSSFDPGFETARQHACPDDQIQNFIRAAIVTQAHENTPRRASAF